MLSRLGDVATWQDAVCETCGSGIDEGQLLMCDGCNMGRHTYCARPQLMAVPEGDWFCEVCQLKERVKQLVGEHVGASAPVHDELTRVTHGVLELWRFKVPLTMTGCQLLHHLKELLEALDRAKLR